MLEVGIKRRKQQTNRENFNKKTAKLKTKTETHLQEGKSKRKIRERL